MVLSNVVIVGDDDPSDINISGDLIHAVTRTPINRNPTISFKDVIAFPGLINSHDHLDFNSFPLLGNYKYKTYVEWGNNIHQQNKEDIECVLKIPKSLRVRWGVYKNLLNGITTVVNHGPTLPVEQDLISVFQKCNSIHSIQLEKNWKFRLNVPRITNYPYVTHVGEGIDESASREIDLLIRWNVFRKQLIGIHGVAMSIRQARHFRALVWCPDSNLFLLGKTADINQLKNATTILFGTDSTLTGSWDLWQQLSVAMKTNAASKEAIFNMLTANPARIWNLPDNGAIATGRKADIVVAKRKSASSSLDSFFSMGPEDILLVIKNGEIKLLDYSLEQRLSDQYLHIKEFSKVIVNGELKFVKGNLPGLMEEIKRYYPEIPFPIKS